jgi:hypothetical protein
MLLVANYARAFAKGAGLVLVELFDRQLVLKNKKRNDVLPSLQDL